MAQKKYSEFVNAIIVKKNGFGHKILIKRASYASFPNQTWGQFGQNVRETFFDNLKAILFQSERDIIQTGFERFFHKKQYIFLIDEYQTLHGKVKIKYPPKKNVLDQIIDDEEELSPRRKAKQLDEIEQKGFIRATVKVLPVKNTDVETVTIYLIPSLINAKTDTSITGITEDYKPITLNNVQGIGFTSMKKAKNAGFAHHAKRLKSNVFIDPNL